MAIQPPIVPELPKRFPLAVQPENRGETADKDARLINGFLENRGGSEFHVYRRSGYAEFAEYSSPAATGYGIFNWQDEVYSIAGGNFYKHGVLVGAVNDNGKPYTFSSILGATPSLVFGNGTATYSYSSGAGLQVVTGVQPPHGLPGWAFVDGTLYYMTMGAQIYGSGINDLTTWDPLNFISAQVEPDFGVALAKNLVYVIALKEWTTEVFYDKGNATGSPLAPVQGGLGTYGCASAASVQNIEGVLFWLGTTRSGAVEVLMMKDLKIQSISTPAIERLFLAETFATVYSWSYKGGGHSFYILTLVDLNLTLAYDITENYWYQWADTNGNYMPIVSSTFVGTLVLLQHVSNGKVFVMLPIYNTDDGQLTTWDLYTPNFDAGVDRRKTLNILRLTGDRIPGCTITASSNDYDYDPTKWSAARTFDMGVQRPMLVNCGTFYRRAYHFSNRTNTRLRLTSADLQMSLGSL